MTDEVLFETRGSLGLITLNRPQALNALNRAMCLAIHAQLDAWRDDLAVEVVAIQGSGDRAFCAGGDVVGLYHAGKSGSADWEGFFHDEYRMNHAIATYPKPYVALIDGITMGGGVGLSIHAPYRIATERTLFAMPETGIGLIPDVGGTHALPRLPGELGAYLGLTGARLKGADSVYAEIATHFCLSENIAELIEALAAGGDIQALLGDFDTDPGDAPIAAHRAAIDTYFDGSSVEAIIASLDEGNDWAQAQAATLRRMSPTSCKLTLRALREGATMDIAGALRTEYRIVCAIKHGSDFFEGVRAQLIDKDRSPKWVPASLAEVGDAEVQRYFEPPAGGDLSF
ncbi:MAG: enoyl-CoA hydratase/isomerase family protein [Sphingomonadaceae bacterium]|nr:enoyl-CoA hydratase/isomerase family protein [Sphingomonadaceae bacterium]